MSAKAFAQACQLGGAIQRGLLSKDDAAKFIQLGMLAAAGNNDAIELQAAVERGEDADLGAATKLLSAEAPGPKPPIDPLAGGQNPNPIKPNPFPNPLAPK